MPCFAWKLLYNIALYNLCKILLGSHKVVVSGRSLLLGCEAVSGEWFHGVSKDCCATFFKGKQSKNFLLGLLTFEDKGTMILQSIWNYPVTQGHKPEDLNGCQNLRVCTVVSVWY